MGLRINQNIAAMNAYRNLSVTDGQMSKSLEKLSSGFRINRAADDAAGLSISEGLRSQIGGLKQAVRNAQDGVNVLQTADGALTEVHSILQRMRDLAVQSANDSNDSTSRTALNAEATSLKAELGRIADKTTFNNANLLDGNYTGKLFQVGYAQNDTIQVDISATATHGATSTWNNGVAASTANTATFTLDGVAVTTGTLSASTDANNIATQLNNDANFAAVFSASVTSTGGLQVVAKDASLTGTITVGGTGVNAASSSAAAASGNTGFSDVDLNVNGVNLTSQSTATTAIGDIDTAIQSVSTARAKLGALQNRFEHTLNNINVAVQNLSASESQIRDTDMAQEMTQFTRAQILQQAGTAMLAQANQAPQTVLELLQ